MDNNSTGFAFWDRRTMIRKAVDESVGRIECKGSLPQLINAIIRMIPS